MSTATSSVSVTSAAPDETARRALAGMVGMVLFLFTEAMLFAGLLSAFAVFRIQAPEWPPPGQPRLPVAATGANTVVLLLSGYTMLRAIRETRRGGSGTARWLALTAMLGAVFVAVQGYEWARLLGFGLSTRSGVYGATFYAIVGIHAAHVVAALLVLGVTWGRAVRGAFTRDRHTGIVLTAMFWIFVVAIWPVLYALLYEPWRRW